VSSEELTGAEQTAAFMLERVQRARGKLWDEGARKKVPEGDGPEPSGPALRTFARRRIRGVSEPVVRGLLAWDRGLRPVDLLEEIPTAAEVLARQACGRRCVSLIDDARAAAHGDPRHQDGLAFVVSPKHRFAQRKTLSIADLGMETFIAHNVVSPHRESIVREFRRHKVPLNMDVEMPTLESIRKLVQANEGVAFLPRMVVQQELDRKLLCEVKVKELHLVRPIRLLYPRGRALSHAAQAFLDVIHTKTT
jgi:DNA-binding transcriptional LysR family regulator